MRKWRLLFLVALLLLPVGVFLVAGIYMLWMQGWWWWLWWLLPVCWGTAYLLARRWSSDWIHPSAAQWPLPPHWTPRDERAAQIIETQQQAVRDVAPARLTDPQFYLDTALNLSLRIAQHYHPHTKDPLSALTIPEILALAHLAAEDMEKWVRDYVPGSHLLTVQQWRALAKAPDWLRTVGNLSWAVAVLLQPVNLGRFLASKFTMDSATRQVQANVLAWFYVTFVRQVGFYVIEMNSGRLRGGAERYRALQARLRPAAEAVAGGATAASPPDDEPLEVVVAIVGQLKSGKSSLINALLGEHRAATDVLPTTQQVRRHQLEWGATRDRLILLDTPGYGGEGPNESQFRETQLALRQADLVLLVMNATHPARQADLRTLRELAEWFARDARRRPVPVLGILTHIDLLSPVLEWSPPYDWQNPTSTKAHNIRAAVEHHRATFGDRLAGIIPVCTDVLRRRAAGIEEHLLPAMLAVLDEARAACLLRALHEESNRGQVSRLVEQLCRAGVELLRSQWPS